MIGTLFSTSLSGGSGSVLGSFIWTSPDTIVSTTGAYEVTFVPEDPMNYAVSTCEVDVKVTPVISDSDTGIQCDLSQAGLPKGVTSVSIASSVESTMDASGLIFSVLSDMVNADADRTSNVLTIYDLSFLNQNGDHITGFSGKITVRIPAPHDIVGNLHVLSYDPVAEKLTDMNA